MAALGSERASVRVCRSRGASALFGSPFSERVVLLPWFASPPVHSVARKPNPMYVNHGKHGDTDCDEDAGSTEIMRNDGRYGERRQDLEHTAPQRQSGI